jgi:DNA-binding transcriptional ArsR family regulator
MGPEPELAVAAAEADVFEALGDAHRREILALLAHRERAVNEIASCLPISRPAVSRHLRLLKEAGLVGEEAAGTRRIYHLREEGLDALRRYVESVWGVASVRFRLYADNLDGSAP